MTFRHSLYLSIAAHLLIFSSAIAVAQYAIEYFVSYPYAIPVSLISLSTSPRGGEGSIQKQSVRKSTTSLKPVDVMSEPRLDAQLAFPADVSTALKVPEATQADVAGNINNDVGADVQRPVIASAGAGQGEGARMGFIASQQWTAIQAAIERTKNYPRLARERGIEGEVRLRFKLNSAGSVETVEVVKSSGYEILDTASIKAVYRAAPMPSVPGWIELPIAYVLQ
jgi:TonB family protein